MNPKIHIKESLIFVLIFFLATGLVNLIFSNLGLNIFFSNVIQIIFSISISAFLMTKIFEKEKDFKTSFIRYSLVCFFSLIFAFIILAIMVFGFGDNLIHVLIEFVKQKFLHSSLNIFLLIIPLFFLSLLFGVFFLGLIFVLGFVFGNIIFSFLFKKK